MLMVLCRGLARWAEMVCMCVAVQLAAAAAVAANSYKHWCVQDTGNQCHKLNAIVSASVKVLSLTADFVSF